MDILYKIFLRLLTIKKFISIGSKFADDYPVDEISLKAKLGNEAIYPFSKFDEYGRALLGADIYYKPTKFYTLDRLILLPPAFTPLRLKKMEELLREPVYTDVSTEVIIGGFKSKLPLTVASMGSTDVANKLGIKIAIGAARSGIIMGIGENVATMRGYDKRISKNQPTFKERIISYLENLKDDYGGVVIQQNVEDAYDELWNKVYSDKYLEQYIDKGLIAFEIKLGQGAKPGLGGEVKVSREEALKLKQKYYFPEDPEKIKKRTYERHSAPGTFTEDILSSMIRLMKNNYPRIKIWIKTGPYRDLDKVIEVAWKSGVDAVVIDGKEGGTGMSPVIAMKDLGYPTIVCLKKIRDAHMKNMNMSLLISGRLYNGGHVVKSLALGATAVSMGRPFIIAARYGIKGVENFVNATKTEIQMLISALGKYKLQDLSNEDLGTLDKELAEMFDIEYVYSSSKQAIKMHTGILNL
ncbi:MAG: glutamate synthase-related protein [Thermoprotei archaeon]